MSRAAAAVAAFLSGILITLLVVETALNQLPVISGRVRAADESLWPLRNYEPATSYTYSYGWDMRRPQSGHTNNYGQLAAFDYVRGKAEIAVIGDSFIEAAMIGNHETMQARLAERLQRADGAIGLAASGLSLVDYVVMADQAQRHLAPSAYVLSIIDGDVSQSLLDRQGWHQAVLRDGSWRILYRPLRTAGAELNQPKQILRETATYRYLRRNLGWQPSDVFRWVNFRAAPSADPVESDPRLPALIDFLLAELTWRTGVPTRCVALVFDSDRSQLYGGLPASDQQDSAATRSLLMRRAAEAGFAVIDLAPRFAAHYRNHQLRFDHSPSDRHWNAIGHRIAADAAADALAACPTIRWKPSSTMSAAQ